MGFVNMETRKMSEKEEAEFLKTRLHECVMFLMKWKVTRGHRTETVEDAFVAITELERNIRLRISVLARILNEEIIPF